MQYFLIFLCLLSTGQRRLLRSRRSPRIPPAWLSMLSGGDGAPNPQVAARPSSLNTFMCIFEKAIHWTQGQEAVSGGVLLAESLRLSSSAFSSTAALPLGLPGPINEQCARRGIGARRASCGVQKGCSCAEGAGPSSATRLSASRPSVAPRPQFTCKRG